MADQATDWIKWTGGEQPVSDNTPVQVRFAHENPREYANYPALPAGYYDKCWPRTSRSRLARIIAYRVVPA